MFTSCRRTGTPVGDTLGNLTVVKDSDTTGTGAGGQLTWTYAVEAAAVEYLAKDQTKLESFTITLDDQHGGLITKQIDVTITGTNDVPVISAGDLVGAVTERPRPAGNLTDSGRSPSATSTCRRAPGFRRRARRSARCWAP